MFRLLATQVAKTTFGRSLQFDKTVFDLLLSELNRSLTAMKYTSPLFKDSSDCQQLLSRTHKFYVSHPGLAIYNVRRPVLVYPFFFLIFCSQVISSATTANPTPTVRTNSSFTLSTPIDFFFFLISRQITQFLCGFTSQTRIPLKSVSSFVACRTRITALSWSTLRTCWCSIILTSMEGHRNYKQR